MQLEKFNDNWLFEKHSKSTYQNWLKQLHFFYFKRAYGGHSNDGDEFQVAILFENINDLIFKLNQIGLKLKKIPKNPSKLIVGKSYSINDFNNFKSEIKIYPDFEQPGTSTIFGHDVFIWVNEKSFYISISGTIDNNCYDVSEEDFKVCIELEKQFFNLDWQDLIDKSLEENICCISKSKYPELYLK